MERRDFNSNGKQPELPIRRSTVTSATLESNLTTTSTTSTSTSSSSLSPPCFLKNVQAALKRHRPLGAMPSTSLRARRVPVSQLQPSKGIDAPNAPPISDKVPGRVGGVAVASRSLDATFEQERGAPEDSSLTAPSISGTITNCLPQGGATSGCALVSDPQRGSSRVIPSSQMASEGVPPDGRPENVLPSLTGARGDERMTTDRRVGNIPSHMTSLALTEGKVNEGGFQQLEDQAPKQPGFPQTEMSDISSKFFAARTLEKRSERGYDPHPVDPMTQCSTVGSSCATTMSLHSGPTIQCTRAASAAQTVAPTQMSISSLEIPGRVHDHACPDGQGASAKEGDALLSQPKALDGRLDGKGLQGDANNSQVLVRPLAKNTSSNVDAEPSQPTKSEKVPRKKKHDPDLFFKVNGKLYQKLGKIGSGGSSEVYKVISSDCTIYALKRIKLKGRDYPTAYGFCQEIEYLNKLKGRSNIIELVDYEVTDKTLLEEVMSGCMTNKDGRIKDDCYIYMVLEYGEIDLAHMLSQKWKEVDNSNGKMNGNWLRFYWQQMLEAVNTIHEERIVHSDLKPANFLLVKGSLKLIDFGIAKAIMSDTTNIQRDAQVGTLNYMSPEAFMWNEHDANGNTIKCGRPSDIWSLGCILYQMVYGRTPFADYKTFWAKFKVITDRNHKIVYEPISNPWLIDLMKKCLAWDRSERWKIPQLLQHPFLNPPMPPLEIV